jgi:hypothetical protein
MRYCWALALAIGKGKGAARSSELGPAGCWVLAFSLQRTAFCLSAFAFREPPGFRQAPGTGRWDLGAWA